jgi:hypothetical protein
MATRPIHASYISLSSFFRDVTVKKILAKPGDSLAVDAVIMEFA